MRVLGISAFYHDSAAALVEDGAIVAAAQEERFSRVKHDPRFPQNAVAFCLSAASGAPDAVVFYEKPLRKFERILTTAMATAPSGFQGFVTALPAWLRQKLWIPYLIEQALGRAGFDARGRVFFTTHHEAHAASAFLPSPFSRAAILTLDGVGEWTTAALGRGRDGRVELIRELRFPHSLGLLYSAFTYFCGFRVNSGEYKLMGLAPFGVPRFQGLILERFVDLRADGSFRLNLGYFDYLRGTRMTGERFARLFGGPRRPPEAAITQRECDLARSIQAVTEEIVLRMARTLHQETGEENLCLAGGVALNCVANGRLLREGPFARVWVQPAAGDAGGALGAALAYASAAGAAPSAQAWSAPSAPARAERPKDGIHDDMRGALLGPAFPDEIIAATLAERGISAERLASPAAVAQRVAARIAGGAVVGVLQGRAEFGPRALGSRSILADARRPEMQQVLNQKIKFRESFRPYAPVVLADRAREYFDLAVASPYMLFTAPVRPEHRRPAGGGAPAPFPACIREVRSDIPAVTHVDYSARVQTVAEADQPFLHAVLTEFDRLTGCPVMINTSFNVRGEPPVCHPREALEGFLRTGLDALAMGSFFVDKASLPAHVLPAAGPPAIAPD